MIGFYCVCGNRLKVHDVLADRVAQCPHYGTALQVPSVELGVPSRDAGRPPACQDGDTSALAVLARAVPSEGQRNGSSRHALVAGIASRGRPLLGFAIMLVTAGLLVALFYVLLRL
jgi:hypothetical protein